MTSDDLIITSSCAPLMTSDDLIITSSCAPPKLGRILLLPRAHSMGLHGPPRALLLVPVAQTAAWRLHSHPQRVRALDPLGAACMHVLTTAPPPPHIGTCARPAPTRRLASVLLRARERMEREREFRPTRAAIIACAARSISLISFWWARIAPLPVSSPPSSLPR
jgi:hypothetical protein